jgi:hypothetical protein
MDRQVQPHIHRADHRKGHAHVNNLNTIITLIKLEGKEITPSDKALAEKTKTRILAHKS